MTEVWAEGKVIAMDRHGTWKWMEKWEEAVPNPDGGYWIEKMEVTDE
jgi:hypothetical protein